MVVVSESHLLVGIQMGAVQNLVYYRKKNIRMIDYNYNIYGNKNYAIKFKCCFLNTQQILAIFCLNVKCSSIWLFAHNWLIDSGII